MLVCSLIVLGLGFVCDKRDDSDTTAACVQLPPLLKHQRRASLISLLGEPAAVHWLIQQLTLAGYKVLSCMIFADCKAALLSLTTLKSTTSIILVKSCWEG